MKIAIEWSEHIVLYDGWDNNLIFNIEEEDIEDYYNVAGIYVFCRSYGNKLYPLYIGQSENIGKRLKQHLGKVKLMESIRKQPKGKKIVIVGKLNFKQKQNKL
jgi:hypothetical protein